MSSNEDDRQIILKRILHPILRWFCGDGLQIVQVIPPLFHPFLLSTAVVVLLNNLRADICPVANDLVWHVAVQAVRDASTTDGVRAHTRWALRSGISRVCLAVVRVAVVRTLVPIGTGTRPPVHVHSERRLL